MVCHACTTGMAAAPIMAAGRHAFHGQAAELWMVPLMMMTSCRCAAGGNRVGHQQPPAAATAPCQGLHTEAASQYERYDERRRQRVTVLVRRILCVSWERLPVCMRVAALHGETYRGLAPPKNTTKQRTHTINPNERQSAQCTDQAPGTIDTKTHESSHVTPTSTAILHATNTATPSQHTQTQQGHRQGPQAGRAAQQHRLKQAHAAAPAPRGAVIMRNWWTAADARVAALCVVDSFLLTRVPRSASFGALQGLCCVIRIAQAKQ